MDFRLKKLLTYTTFCGGLCAIAPAQADIITYVSPIAALETQTITISGSGFGTNAPYIGDSDYIVFTDVTAGGWEAGYNHGLFNSHNGTTLDITSWTDTSIVIAGFAGTYNYNPLNNGDVIDIQVWNPQTGAGPSSYDVTVAAAVPEPAALLLIASGFLALGAYHRKKRQA
jgi:hypothetical protein